MFKRRKDEDRTELDAAWEDEVQQPIFGGAADHSADGADGADSADGADGAEAGSHDQAGASAAGASAADAAFGDADASLGAGGTGATWHESADGHAFPEPNTFNVRADSVPTNATDREAFGDAPFDVDESFAYDAESEEFTSGDAAGFLDDSHADYYRYGQQKHGVHDTEGVAETAAAVTGGAAAGRHGRHGSGRTSKQAELDQMPEHQRRSRRMRRILTVIIVLLLALLAALAYFGYQLYQTSRSVAVQETEETTTEVEVAAETEEVATDAAAASTKKTDVPPLLTLIGKDADDAIDELGHGATVTLDSEVADPENPMFHRLTVVLTEEPTDAKSGTPTVYLGLDGDEKVVTVGYSAATASLGYGTLSFADTVSNEHVVEKTLGEAGLAIPEGSVVLPEREAYTTLADDGETLVKEQCAFDGEAAANGVEYGWTSVLVYNYTAANATGNLADTVRQIYVYITDKDAGQKAVEAKSKAASDAAAADSVNTNAAANAQDASSAQSGAQGSSSAQDTASSAQDASSAQPSAQSSAQAGAQ